MRVFWDTNVLASAFGPGGFCLDLLALAHTGRHEIVISPQVLMELEAALLTRFHLPPHMVSTRLTFLRGIATTVEDASASAWAVRDADDARILGAAEAAGVDVLVTGDRDLLDVADGAPVRIVSPRALWDLLNAADAGEE